MNPIEVGGETNQGMNLQSTNEAFNKQTENMATQPQFGPGISDEFDDGIIRNKIREFYVVCKEVTDCQRITTSPKEDGFTDCGR